MALGDDKAIQPFDALHGDPAAAFRDETETLEIGQSRAHPVPANADHFRELLVSDAIDRGTAAPLAIPGLAGQRDHDRVELNAGVVEHQWTAALDAFHREHRQ